MATSDLLGVCAPATLDTTVPDGPPPLAGGTVLTLSDAKTAIVSDPDFDRIWVVDTSPPPKARAISLLVHDEPGRSVEDARGKVHVVLRGGGAIVTIDPIAATIVSRDNVCVSPRGIAFDPTANLIHVACAAGELVSLPADGGAPTRTLQLDDDLRDAVVVNRVLMVSRFRSAELLTIDASGTVTARRRPADYANPTSNTVFTPSVAWRTIAMPDGRVAMLHQRGTTATLHASGRDLHLPPQPNGLPSAVWGGVGNPCDADGPIIESVVTIFDATFAAPKSYAPISGLTLPVDIAISPDGAHMLVVGASGGFWRPDQRLVVSTLDLLDCRMIGFTVDSSDVGVGGSNGVAAAFLGNDVMVQSRAPWMLYFGGQPGVRSVPLSTDATADQTGFTLFHQVTNLGIACASCHPEGGDDGRVWHLDIGDRRTKSLRGGLRGTEPLHWDGDEPDFLTLVNDVFTDRMYGAAQTCEQRQALSNWLESIPLIAARVGDWGAFARGKSLFEDPVVGCADCHNGPHFTNSQIADVGTDGTFQTPRLGNLTFHAPYLHDGRAATLKDRFGPAGGGNRHGHTSQLSADQIDDLIAYLNSL